MKLTDTRIQIPLIKITDLSLVLKKKKIGQINAMAFLACDVQNVDRVGKKRECAHQIVCKRIENATINNGLHSMAGNVQL